MHSYIFKAAALSAVFFLSFSAYADGSSASDAAAAKDSKAADKKASELVLPQGWENYGDERGAPLGSNMASYRYQNPEVLVTYAELGDNVDLPRQEASQAASIRLGCTSESHDSARGWISISCPDNVKVYFYEKNSKTLAVTVQADDAKGNKIGQEFITKYLKKKN